MSTNNSTEDTVTGRCLCGAVRFTARLPAKWCAHCHCTDCRAAHGAAFVTWVGFLAAQIRFDEGEQRLVHHASSPGAQRSFCGTCGSTLFFRAQRWPGEVHAVRACLEGDLGLAPQGHVFYDRHVDWCQVGDTLPRYGGESGTEPLQG